MFVCMSVCVYVRNGVTIGFTHSLHTFWHVMHMMPLRIMRWRSRTQRIEDARTVQGYIRRLTAQQKNERQHNRDRRRLVHQHPSDLLCLLTRGRDRQRTARRRLDCTSTFAISSDQTFHVLSVRHMMRVHIVCVFTGIRVG